MTFRFQSKGENLAQLSNLLDLPTVPDQVLFDVAQWRSGSAPILSQIGEKFGGQALVVRSSTRREDQADQSYAGAFLSLVGIDPDHAPLSEAIEQVIESFGGVCDSDQVLVQPQVIDVSISGVVFTRDLDTGSPYYVVNYDDFSGRTDTVTGGSESKTILVHRGRLEAVRSERFQKLMAVIQEVEAVTGSQTLDIEFCIDANDTVYLLQVRPLQRTKGIQRIPDETIDAGIDRIREFLQGRMAAHPDLAGRTTILGEMPDWNPAEMIGNAPHPLALSLYKYLITDTAWAQARARMGYRDLSAHPLMVDLEGHPYIDVRVSLNSFLPADLPETVAARLIDHQLETLRAHRELHDKIEFQIAVSCADFGLDDRLAHLAEEGLPGDALETLRRTVVDLTANCLREGVPALDACLDQTRTLLTPLEQIPEDPRDRALERLARAIPTGTIPFSILARHAFIGMSFLKSLVAKGALTAERAGQFMRSIHTVAADIVTDMYELAQGRTTQKAFLDRYGHLRPGTYDILSFRYDERPDMYLGHSSRPPPPEPPFTLTADEHAAIAGLIEAIGFELTPEDLLEYIRVATCGREEAKFNFTKSISDALVDLCQWGEGVGLSREDVSFLTIDEIRDATGDEDFRPRIGSAQQGYDLTRTIKLPHLIVTPDGTDVVRLPLGQPTYITKKSVTGEKLRLDPHEAPDIDDRIVLIESADPGFDWIFSHPILGLITKFGGANSHMAIRCAEFGVPAAIGCGERLFESLDKGRVLELNCAAKTVKQV